MNAIALLFLVSGSIGMWTSDSGPEKTRNEHYDIKNRNMIYLRRWKGVASSKRPTKTFKQNAQMILCARVGKVAHKKAPTLAEGLVILRQDGTVLLSLERHVY